MATVGFHLLRICLISRKPKCYPTEISINQLQCWKGPVFTIKVQGTPKKHCAQNMVGPGIGRDFLSGEIFGNRNRWQITDTAELPQGIGIGAVTTVMVGCLIGILIMVYYNPYIYITGEFPIPYIIQPTRVFFRGS